MVKNASPILSALRAATTNEAAAVEFLEQQRWGDTPACPKCGSVAVYRMMATDGTRNKDFRLRCRDCKVMFTVRTGTTFEESRLPLRVWVYCFWKACASKKGISALQLSREMEITHKSALFVLRRIRHGMTDLSTDKLTGTVEVDETYVGGKPRRKQNFRGTRRGNPSGNTNKVPVVAMVQRNGDVRYRMMERVTAAKLGQVIRDNADLSCRLMTDESPAYIKVGRKFAGGHETVKHGAREYVRGDVFSNTVESVFSLLKRGVVGTFHSVSKKHLPNYLGEFEFRWNTRHNNDGERVAKAIRAMEGKRIEYRESVDNPPYLVG
jgi:transposase-like protein